MENAHLSFSDIPIRYKSLQDQIENEIISKIYSNLSFSYLTLENIPNIKSNDLNASLIEDLLFDHLKIYHFITYHFLNLDNEKQFNFTEKVIRCTNHLNIHRNTYLSNVDAVFCAESECIIIKKISIYYKN